MKFILSCDRDFQDIARQQCADGGIELSPSKAILVGTDRTPIELWGPDEERYFVSSLKKAVEEWKPGDMVFLDIEVPDYTMHRAFKKGTDIPVPVEAILNKTAELFFRIRAALPYAEVGIYGYPYSRHWYPTTTTHAIEGAEKVFAICNPDYMCPVGYMNYPVGSGEQGSRTLTPQRATDRITSMVKDARSAAGKDKPVYLFHQIIFTGTPLTHGTPLNRESVEVFFNTARNAGVDGIFLWMQYGESIEQDDGSKVWIPDYHLERNKRELKRQGPWMNEAMKLNTPGEK